MLDKTEHKTLGGRSMEVISISLLLSHTLSPDPPSSSSSFVTLWLSYCCDLLQLTARYLTSLGRTPVPRPWLQTLLAGWHG